MNILVYILIAVFIYYIGKIERPLNVGILCIPLAVPIGIFTAISSVIILVIFVKTLFIVIGLLLLLISKLKAYIGAKIALMLISAGASVLGIAFGPIGWMVTLGCGLLFFFIVGSAIIDTFKALYGGFFAILSKILLKIRILSDKARKPLPKFFKFIVLTIELPLVCGLSIKGVWDLMNWADGELYLSPLALLCRLVIVIPFTIILYRSYIKSTQNYNNENDGVDVPMPIDIGGSVTTFIHH